MPGPVLKKILQKQWIDAETGHAVHIPLSLKQVAIDYNAIKRINAMIKETPLGDNILIISDENTHEALGKAVYQLVKEEYACQELVLPVNVFPALEVIKMVQGVASQFSGIIAVGSGTINDICKYASSLNEQPYMICATAPSMNGYLSQNASIIDSGRRTSVDAHLPVAVLMDLKVMAAAPERLIQSGYGDLLCRTTAQADWFMSHVIFGTPYNGTPFAMLKPIETQLFGASKKLLTKDLDALQILCEALLISGVGMTHAGGSYPASQAEHMIAHTIEMKHGNALPKRYHGEMIAVTTVTMAALQTAILNQAPFDLKALPIESGKVNDYYGKGIGQECLQATAGKQKTNEELIIINKNLETKWPMLVKEIKANSRSAEHIQELAFHVKMPVDSQSLGLSHTQFREAVAYAPYSRMRYTFLDLLLMQKK